MSTQQPSARQEQIRKQAKQIMDNFFVALKNANIEPGNIGVSRQKQTRQPVSGAVANSNSTKDSAQFDKFRAGMFANAPDKDIDYILAEKKHW